MRPPWSMLVSAGILAVGAAILGSAAGGGAGGPSKAFVWPGRVPGKPEVWFATFQEALRKNAPDQVALCVEDRGAPADDPFVIAMGTYRGIPGGAAFDGKPDEDLRRAAVMKGILRRREEFLRMRVGAPAVGVDRYAVLRAEPTSPEFRTASQVRMAPSPAGWRIAESESVPTLLRETRRIVLEKFHDCLEYCHLRSGEAPLSVKDVAAMLLASGGGYVPDFPIRDESIDDYVLLMPLAAGTPARTMVAWSLTPDIEGNRSVLLWNGTVELVSAGGFAELQDEALTRVRPAVAPLLADAKRQLETASASRKAALQRRIALLEQIEKDAAVVEQR